MIDVDRRGLLSPASMPPAINHAVLTGTLSAEPRPPAARPAGG